MVVARFSNFVWKHTGSLTHILDVWHSLSIKFNHITLWFIKYLLVLQTVVSATKCECVGCMCSMRIIYQKLDDQHKLRLFVGGSYMTRVLTPTLSSATSSVARFDLKKIRFPKIDNDCVTHYRMLKWLLVGITQTQVKG